MTDEPKTSARRVIPSRQEYVTKPLLDFDPSGETTVTLREPRFQEGALRGAFLNAIEDGIADIDGIGLVVYELWLTFVDAEIWGGLINEDGESVLTKLFHVGMDYDEFRRMVFMLPEEVIYEWHDHAMNLAPEWRG